MRSEPLIPDGKVVAQVRRVSARVIEVAAETGTACGSCSAKCGARHTPQTVVVEARARGAVATGQPVVLQADDGALANVSLALYFLPAVGFLLGAFLAYSASWGDGPQALMGLLGLAAGLFYARCYLRRRYRACIPLSVAQSIDS